MTHSPHPILPSQNDFAENFSAGKPQLVWSKLIADLETPVSAVLKLQEDDKPCFLLESVEGGELRGRYSIIGLKPDLIWRCHKRTSEVCRDAQNAAPLKFIACADDSVTSLKALIAESQLDIPDGLPPMAAGLIGYMGYDMIKLIETIPSNNPDPIDIPDACLMRPGVTVIFDGRDGVVHIVTPVWNHANSGSNISADDAYAHAVQMITNTVNTLAQPLHQASQFTPKDIPAINFTPNMTQGEFEAMVNHAKDYILAGDIFQMVPSQRFSTPFKHSPMALYRSLRYLNPSPFLFYLHLEDFSLVGSSPEILVRSRDGKITIRPLAGTRKRGASLAEDEALEAELLSDPKELAEHLMLLDLGRNDVGRCAKTGTVKVTEHMQVERYSHVMHIVSNVEGELDDEKHGAFDALMSGFPAGTVSGAPKIRAMEIIDDLEPHARSFYAGCVGYFSANGSMDTCITLRTGLIKDDILHLQSGGGVVADSDPTLEYEESLNKAKALMRAAEFACQFED